MNRFRGPLASRPPRPRWVRAAVAAIAVAVGVLVLYVALLGLAELVLNLSD